MNDHVKTCLGMYMYLLDISHQSMLIVTIVTPFSNPFQYVDQADSVHVVQKRLHQIINSNLLQDRIMA